MNRILLSVLFFVPFFASAQSEGSASESIESSTTKTFVEAETGITKKNGVDFDERSSYQQIKDSSRKTGKYIFLDCYATWCGPCKAMDRDVYTNDSVAEAMKDFICVKVQCDSGKNDNEYARLWYADAHNMMEKYGIHAFPSFLFFSPDGELVHREEAYHKPSEFIRIVKDAMNPEKQFYTLLRNYAAGNKDYSVMPYLASKARKFHLNDSALIIAEDYMHNYLDKLPDDKFCTKDNLDFISTYFGMVKSSDRIVDWYFHHASAVNSVAQDKGYSSRGANAIVYKEEIAPELLSAKQNRVEPHWNAISASIKKHFGVAYVKRNVLNGKIKYYKSTADWKHYSHYVVEKCELDSIENSPKDFWGAYGLNNSAWDIFQHSNNKKELKTALKWSELALQIGNPSGGDFDTKANLLYKLGKKEEAMSIESKAIAMEPANKDLQENYRKMQAGEPTW